MSPVKLLVNDVELYHMQTSPEAEDEFFRSLLEGVEDGQIVAVNETAKRHMAIRGTDKAKREAVMTEPGEPIKQDPPAPSVPRRVTKKAKKKSPEGDSQ